MRRQYQRLAIAAFGLLLVPCLALPAQANVAPNPYGCYGKTDYPHYSSGDASVHGRTVCSVPLGRVSVTTTLTRDRWYGRETLNRDTSTRNFSVSSYDAHPHWLCVGKGKYTYHGDSYHEASDGARTYTGWTSATGTFWC